MRRSVVAGSIVSVNTTDQSGASTLTKTTLTSHTDNSSEKVDFINIYGADADNRQQKRRHRRSYRSRWAAIKRHWDRVSSMVQESRAVRWMGRCLHEGGDALPESIRQSNAFRGVERWYIEGGEVLPRNRKEVAMFLVCALLLWPLVHVAIIIATGGGVAGGGRRNDGYFGGEIQFVDSSGRRQQLGGRMGGGRRNKKGTESMIDGVGQFPLVSTGESMSAWAGSSQVMLSKYSSLRENFILIPDADWIELQIIRSRAASSMHSTGPKSHGGFLSSFFRSSSSTHESPRKPPKRLPLPAMIDPVYDPSESMVLFSITRSPVKRYVGDAKYVNALLWQEIAEYLQPRPIDVWPCWNHNSLAQFREDGFAVMYPHSMRQEARMGLTKLAEHVGQSVLYEYVTWSEASPHADVGGGGNILGNGGGSVEERAGSSRLVGKDGSAIVIPALPNGRSDVMIRRTIAIASSSSDAGQEPAVVMRRVKDLPVEDELTMREWEGPPLEKITLK
jgi:hypothetical protein